MNKKKLIIGLLYDNDIEISTINTFLSNFNLKKKELVEIMNLFHNARRNVIERAIKYEQFENLYIRYFLLLTHKKFSNILLNDKEIIKIIEFINIYGKTSFGLISTMISLSQLNQLEIIFSRASHLKQIHVFKLIKRSLQLGSEDIFNAKIDLIVDDEKRSKLELIKSYYSDEGVSIKTVEKSFTTINDNFLFDYKRLIPSFVNLVDDEKNLFELRYDSKAQRKLYRKLIRSLDNREPFSFVRLSDGEAYAFSHCSQLSRRQEIHWWGVELSSELRREIKEEFNRNLSIKFNIIGMPTPYKFLHYIDYKTNTSIELNADLERKVVNRLAYSTTEIINRMECNKINASSYTEDQINNVLFTENVLNHLAQKANRLIIISGYKAKFLRDKIRHDNLLVKEIPTHYMLSGRGETVNSEKPLPYVYKDILSWIEANVEPGDLCLISAGFIGKIFIGKAFTKGAISLDVGQSLKVLF